MIDDVPGFFLVFADLMLLGFWIWLFFFLRLFTVGAFCLDHGIEASLRHIGGVAVGCWRFG